MLAGKAGAYPNETLVKLFSGAPLEVRLLALPANNRLGWKCLPGANALAYYENSVPGPNVETFLRPLLTNV